MKLKTTLLVVALVATSTCCVVPNHARLVSPGIMGWLGAKSTICILSGIRLNRLLEETQRRVQTG